jgi:hypothetical protein
MTRAAITPPEIQSMVPKETAIAATGIVSITPGMPKDGLTKNQSHGISDLSQEDGEWRWTPRWLQSIGSILLSSLASLRVGKTSLGFDFEGFQDFSGSSGVGVEVESSVGLSSFWGGSSLFGFAIAVGGLLGQCFLRHARCRVGDHVWSWPFWRLCCCRAMSRMLLMARDYDKSPSPS